MSKSDRILRKITNVILILRFTLGKCNNYINLNSKMICYVENKSL